MADEPMEGEVRAAQDEAASTVQELALTAQDEAAPTVQELAPTAQDEAAPTVQEPAPLTAREAALLPLSMVLVQSINVGMLVLSKLVLDAGMSPFVIIVYRNLIAAAAVAPLAIIFERDMWKEVNWTVGGLIFANAAFGDVLAMGFYFYGLRITSATYSSVFLNLIPVATFLISMVLRVEKLALANWTGRMILMGALLCVGGTMMVSLLEGRLLHLWPENLLKYHAGATVSTASPHQDMVVGTLWLCGSCLSYAVYFIVQARLVNVFPSTYWMTLLTCIVGSMQSLVVGVFLVHDRAEWRLKWDLQLLTVVYSGVFNTGLAFLLLTWVIKRSGPIYPPMFNSLSLILTTILDSVLLGTNIYLGSALGTVLIIAGLYAFLWGKGKELKLAAAAAADAAAAAAADAAAAHDQEQQGGV